MLERAGADVVDLLDGGEDIGIGIEGAVGAAETGPREEVEEDAAAGDVILLGVVQAVPLAAVIEGGGGAVLLGWDICQVLFFFVLVRMRLNLRSYRSPCGR